MLLIPFLTGLQQLGMVAGVASSRSVPLQGGGAPKEEEVHSCAKVTEVMARQPRQRLPRVALRFCPLGVASQETDVTRPAQWLRSRNTALPPTDDSVTPRVLRGPPSARQS